MRVLRNGIFETNSSSTHSIIFNSKNVKIEYNLSESGYIEGSFGDYCSSLTNNIYTTVEEKLRFLLTLLAAIQYERKWKTNFQTPIYLREFTTKKELHSMAEYKEIVKLVKRKIPNCKGIRFRRNSFDEKGICMGSMDFHHLPLSLSLEDYLRNNSVTLEDFLFNPHVVICMNP